MNGVIVLNNLSYNPVCFLILNIIYLFCYNFCR